jgi:hypothetical protein
MKFGFVSKLFFIAFICFYITFIPCISADVTKDEAEIDATQIMELYDKYINKFNGIYGNTVIYSPSIEEAENGLKNIEEAEKEALPAIQPMLAIFAEKYGTTGMEISDKLFKLGLKDLQDAGSRYDSLYKAVENVIKSRKATAEFLAQQVNETITGINFFVPEIRVKKLEEAKELLIIANKFDSNNNDINKMLANIDQQITNMADKIEKDIDKKVWEGHIKDFAGPGKIDELTKTAIEYFKNDKEWGKNEKTKTEILAVAIRGQWKIAETNIFGQVIQWRLPIHLAITTDKLREKNIAKVYELSPVTKIGSPGKTPKEPPFEGFWVGNSWMMRIDKLPAIKKELPKDTNKQEAIQNTTNDDVKTTE